MGYRATDGQTLDATEFWYYIDVPYEGVLKGSVSNASGLSAGVELYASDAITRMDYGNISKSVQPGRYYFKVYRSSGSGSFALTVSFVSK